MKKEVCVEKTIKKKLHIRLALAVILIMVLGYLAVSTSFAAHHSHDNSACQSESVCSQICICAKCSQVINGLHLNSTAAIAALVVFSAVLLLILVSVAFTRASLVSLKVRLNN